MTSNLGNLKLSESQKSQIYTEIGYINKTSTIINFEGMPESQLIKEELNILDMYLMGFNIKMPYKQKLSKPLQSNIIQNMVLTKTNFEKIIFSSNAYVKTVNLYLKYHKCLKDYETLLKYALINNASENLASIQSHIEAKFKLQKTRETNQNDKKINVPNFETQKNKNNNNDDDKSNIDIIDDEYQQEEEDKISTKSEKEQVSEQFYQNVLDQNDNILFLYNEYAYYKAIKSDWVKYQQTFSQNLENNFKLILKYFGSTIIEVEKSISTKFMKFDQYIDDINSENIYQNDLQEKNHNKDEENDDDSEDSEQELNRKQKKLKRQSEIQKRKDLKNQYKNTYFINGSRNEKYTRQNFIKNSHYNQFLVLACKYMSPQGFQEIPEYYFYNLIHFNFQVVIQAVNYMIIHTNKLESHKNPIKKEIIQQKFMIIKNHFTKFLKIIVKQDNRPNSDLQIIYKNQKNYAEKYKLQIQLFCTLLADNLQYDVLLEFLKDLLIIFPPNLIECTFDFKKKIKCNFIIEVDNNNNFQGKGDRSYYKNTQPIIIDGKISKYRQNIELEISNKKDLMYKYSGESKDRISFKGLIQELLENDDFLDNSAQPDKNQKSDSESSEDSDIPIVQDSEFHVTIETNCIQSMLSEIVCIALKKIVSLDRSELQLFQQQQKLALQILELFKIYLNQNQIKDLYLNFLKNPLPQFLNKLLAIYSLESQKSQDVCGLAQFQYEISQKQNMKIYYYQSSFKLYYAHAMEDTFFKQIISDNSEYLASERKLHNDTEFFAVCQSGFSENLKDYINIVIKKQDIEIQTRKLIKGLKELCICYKDYSNKKDQIVQQIQPISKKTMKISKKPIDIQNQAIEESSSDEEEEKTDQINNKNYEFYLNLMLKDNQSVKDIMSLNSYSKEEVYKIFNPNWLGSKKQVEQYHHKYYSDFLKIARTNIKFLVRRDQYISESWTMMGRDTMFKDPNKKFDYQISLNTIVQELEILLKDKQLMQNNNNLILNELEDLIEYLANVSLSALLKIFPIIFNISENKQRLVMKICYEIFLDWQNPNLEIESAEKFFKTYYIQQNIPDFDPKFSYQFKEPLKKISNLSKELQKCKNIYQNNILRLSTVYLKQISTFDKKNKYKIKLRDEHLMGLLTCIIKVKYFHQDIVDLLNFVTKRFKKKTYMNIKYINTEINEEDFEDSDYDSEDRQEIKKQQLYKDDKFLICEPLKGNFLDKYSAISKLYNSDYFVQLSQNGADPYLFSSNTLGILFYISSNNLKMLKVFLKKLENEKSKQEEENMKSSIHNSPLRKLNSSNQGSKISQQFGYKSPDKESPSKNSQVDQYNSSSQIQDRLSQIQVNNKKPLKKMKTKINENQSDEENENPDSDSNESNKDFNNNSNYLSQQLQAVNFNTTKYELLEESIFNFLVQNIQTHNSIFSYLMNIMYSVTFEELIIKALHIKKLGKSPESALLGCLNKYFDSKKIFSKILDQDFFQYLEIKDFNRFLESLIMKGYQKAFIQIFTLIKRDAFNNDSNLFRHYPGLVLSQETKIMISYGNNYQISSFFEENQVQYQIGSNLAEIKFKLYKKDLNFASQFIQQQDDQQQKESKKQLTINVNNENNNDSLSQSKKSLHRVTADMSISNQNLSLLKPQMLSSLNTFVSIEYPQDKYQEVHIYQFDTNSLFIYQIKAKIDRIDNQEVIYTGTHQILGQDDTQKSIEISRALNKKIDMLADTDQQISCNNCKSKIILGVFYKCQECINTHTNFNLCPICYNKEDRSHEHDILEKILPKNNYEEDESNKDSYNDDYDLDDDELYLETETNINKLIFIQDVGPLLQQTTLKETKQQLEKLLKQQDQIQQQKTYNLDLHQLEHQIYILQERVKSMEEYLKVQQIQNDKNTQLPIDFQYPIRYQKQIQLFYLLIQEMNVKSQKFETQFDLLKSIESVIFHDFRSKSFDFEKDEWPNHECAGFFQLVYVGFELHGYLNEDEVDMEQSEILQFYLFSRFKIKNQKNNNKYNKSWEYCQKLDQFKDSRMVKFMNNKQVNQLIKDIKINDSSTLYQTIYNNEQEFIENYLKDYLISQTGQQSTEFIKYLVEEKYELLKFLLTTYFDSDEEKQDYVFLITLNDKLIMHLFVKLQFLGTSNKELLQMVQIEKLIQNFLSVEETSMSQKLKLGKLLFLIFTSIPLSELKEYIALFQIPEIKVRIGQTAEDTQTLKIGEDINFQSSDQQGILGNLFVWLVLNIKTTFFNINWIFHYSDIRKFLRNIIRMQKFTQFPTINISQQQIKSDINNFWNSMLQQFQKTCELTESGRYSNKTDEVTGESLESDLEFQEDNIQQFTNSLIEYVLKNVNSKHPPIIYSNILNLIITAFEQMGFVDYYLDNFKQKKVIPKLFLQKSSKPDKTNYVKSQLKQGIIEIHIYFGIVQKSTQQEYSLTGNFELVDMANPKNIQLEIENYFFSENNDWFIEENLKELEHPYSDLGGEVEKYTDFSHTFQFSEQFLNLSYTIKRDLIYSQIFQGNIYMEYENKIDYNPEIHYDESIFSEQLAKLQDMYHIRDKVGGIASNLKNFRYENVTFIEFQKIIPFYGEQKSNNKIKNKKKGDEDTQEILNKNLIGWVEQPIIDQQQEQEQNQDQKNPNDQTPQGEQQNQEDDIVSETQQNQNQQQPVQKQEIFQKIQLNKQGFFTFQSTDKFNIKDKTVYYQFKLQGTLHQKKLIFIKQYEEQQVQCLYISTDFDEQQNCFKGLGMKIQTSNLKDLQTSINLNKFDYTTYLQENQQSMILNFEITTEQFLIRNINIDYVTPSQFQKMIKPEKLFNTVIENILMYEAYFIKYKQQKQKDQNPSSEENNQQNIDKNNNNKQNEIGYPDSFNQYNLHLNWYYTIIESKNQAMQIEQNENIQDFVQTKLELFPLYNVLQMRKMLNNLVKQIDLPYKSELIKWRINTQSFIEVLVINLYDIMQKYAPLLKKDLNNQNISKKEIDLLNILQNNFYGQGFFGIVKSIIETRFLSIILQKIIYENLKLWIKPLKGIYIEFNKVENNLDSKFEPELSKLLPKGLDKFFRFQKTTYFIQKKILIIRLNIAFVDGDLLKGGEEYFKDILLKKQKEEGIFVEKSKFLRKQIILESQKITQEQFYSLFKENQFIQQYISVVVDQDAMKKELIDKKVCTAKDFIQIQQKIDPSFKTLQELFDEKEDLQKELKKGIWNINSIFEEAYYKHFQLEFETDLKNELEPLKNHHFQTINNVYPQIFDVIEDGFKRVFDIKKEDKEGRMSTQFFNEDFINESNSLKYSLCSLFFKYFRKVKIVFQKDKQFSENKLNTLYFDVDQKVLYFNVFLYDFNQKAIYIQANDLQSCIKKALYINEKQFLQNKIYEINEIGGEVKSKGFDRSKHQVSNQNLENVLLLIKPLLVKLDMSELDEIEKITEQQQNESNKQFKEVFDYDFLLLYLSQIDYLLLNFQIAFLSLYNPDKKSRSRQIYDSIQQVTIKILKEGPPTWKKKTTYSFSYYPKREELQIQLILESYEITSLVPTFTDILLYFNSQQKSLKLQQNMILNSQIEFKQLIQIFGKSKQQTIELSLGKLKENQDYNKQEIINKDNWHIVTLGLNNLNNDIQQPIQNLSSDQQENSVIPNHLESISSLLSKETTYEINQEFTCFIDNQFQEKLNKEELQLLTKAHKSKAAQQKYEEQKKKDKEFIDTALQIVEKKYNIESSKTEIQQKQEEIPVIEANLFKTQYSIIVSNRIKTFHQRRLDEKNKQNQSSNESDFQAKQKLKALRKKRKNQIFTKLLYEIIIKLYPKTFNFPNDETQKQLAEFQEQVKQNSLNYEKLNDEIYKIQKPDRDRQQKIDDCQNKINKLNSQSISRQKAINEKISILIAETKEGIISEDEQKTQINKLKQEQQQQEKISNTQKQNLQQELKNLSKLSKEEETQKKTRIQQISEIGEKMDKEYQAGKKGLSKIELLQINLKKQLDTNQKIIEKLNIKIKKTQEKGQQEIKKTKNLIAQKVTFGDLPQVYEILENKVDDIITELKQIQEEIKILQQRKQDIFLTNKEKLDIEEELLSLKIKQTKQLFIKEDLLYQSDLEQEICSKLTDTKDTEELTKAANKYIEKIEEVNIKKYTTELSAHQQQQIQEYIKAVESNDLEEFKESPLNDVQNHERNLLKIGLKNSRIKTSRNKVIELLEKMIDYIGSSKDKYSLDEIRLNLINYRPIWKQFCLKQQQLLKKLSVFQLAFDYYSNVDMEIQIQAKKQNLKYSLAYTSSMYQQNREQNFNAKINKLSTSNLIPEYVLKTKWQTRNILQVIVSSPIPMKVIFKDPVSQRGISYLQEYQKKTNFQFSHAGKNPNFGVPIKYSSFYYLENVINGSIECQFIDSSKNKNSQKQIQQAQKMK